MGFYRQAWWIRRGRSWCISTSDWSVYFSHLVIYLTNHSSPFPLLPWLWWSCLLLLGRVVMSSASRTAGLAPPWEISSLVHMSYQGVLVCLWWGRSALCSPCLFASPILFCHSSSCCRRQKVFCRLYCPPVSLVPHLVSNFHPQCYGCYHFGVLQ